MNVRGPGYGQYLPNRDLIRVQLKHAAAQGGRVVSTGHSLGGALAQIAGADSPELVQSVVTFAAPAIDKKDVERLRDWNEDHRSQAVTARHYHATGDIVPGGGEQRLDGAIFAFDRYEVSRPQGAEAFKKSNGPAGAAAHNAFVLRDYLARVPQKDLNDVQRAVVQYGGVDSQAFTDGEYDPRKVTAKVLANLSQAQRDPTVQTEAARRVATPFIYAAATTSRLLQDMPYEVLLDRVDKRLARISAEQVKQAGGLKKALAPLRAEILGTEGVVLTMEDVKFYGLMGRDDLVTLGMANAALDRPVKLNAEDRQQLSRRLEERWHYWHPGAEGVK
nr:hypothetical protein [Deinococcus betulae]